MSTFRIDPEKHQLLIDELVAIFQESGYSVVGADGVTGIPGVQKLHNDGYGDQENKAPDIIALNQDKRQMIIGEAKTGDGDFETEHALTQYNVFLDQVHPRTMVKAKLYIIVPQSTLSEFSAFITHYIHPDYWDRLTLVSSKRVQQ
ncbi:MAG: hypothetical protein V1799_06915 [bacterium]